MDYHSDRFEDHSLLAYKEDRLIALLPANVKDGTLYSHQGLSFGGWITDSSMKTATMLLLFERLKEVLQAKSVKALVYKCIPHIYHNTPAEEDRYALFRSHAQLAQCDVTTVIDYRHPLPVSQRRKRGIGKAEKAGITIKESDDHAGYFAMLEQLLSEKYASVPTHTLEEMLLLAGNFPKHIRLFTAHRDAAMLAGVILYESRHVAHVQYIASTEEGRQCGALDLLLSHLISHCSHKRYFDLGTSNEKQGQYLNEGLIGQKEEFGAHAVAHHIYRVPMV